MILEAAFNELISVAMAWLENRKSLGQAVLGPDQTTLVTCDFGWLQKSQRVDLLWLQVTWCHDLNPNRKSVIASCFSSSLAATIPCPHSGKCSKFIYFIYYILLTNNTLSFTRYDTAIPFIFTHTTALVALSQFCSITTGLRKDHCHQDQVFWHYWKCKGKGPGQGMVSHCIIGIVGQLTNNLESAPDQHPLRLIAASRPRR